MDFTTFDPIGLVDTTSGRVSELFAREGDVVHMLTQGAGTTEVNLTEARALVNRYGVKITPDQARILEVEVS